MSFVLDVGQNMERANVHAIKMIHSTEMMTILMKEMTNRLIHILLKDKSKNRIRIHIEID